jgi:hypothetical protein
MSINSIFKKVKKPRDLSEEEIDKFKLTYYGGKRMQLAIETSITVWSGNVTERDPVYRLYNRGTNDLLVLEYD